MKCKHSTVVAVALVTTQAAAHMEMAWPPPFRSKFSPFSTTATIDYSMTSPLRPGGSDFPCKGYHRDMLDGLPAGAATASLAAGQWANISLAGGAMHGGGSCQISLSFDGGQSFSVLQSWEGGCPTATGTQLGFSVPAETPAGDALLAWTWFNNMGNREMYMNCAHITISGGNADGPTEQSLADRPGLFVANIGNGCSTTDNTDVQFPRPGPDVIVQSTKGTVPPIGNTC